jgi:tetratricopeptide (TPR) repeat protein
MYRTKKFSFLESMKYLILFLAIIALTDTWASAQSDQVGAYMDEGVKRHDAGDYRGAIEQYRKALAIDPKSPVIFYELASSYYALKDYRQAIAYADTVFALHGSNAIDACILKGSALDMIGQPQDAVKVYEQGLRTFPDDHLLAYNLAYTQYNLHDLENARDNVKKALLSEPSHASGHLLLGIFMQERNKRVRSVLALYNFLLLEPKGDRAVAALKMLDAELQEGVKRKGKDTHIEFNPDRDKDEFSSAELMLSMLEASKNLESNEGKTEQELFCANTKTFLGMLGELKKSNKGFWWNFYVDYFASLAGSENMETFCYYVRQSAGEAPVMTWLSQHKEKVAALENWVRRTRRK